MREFKVRMNKDLWWIVIKASLFGTIAGILTYVFIQALKAYLQEV